VVGQVASRGLEAQNGEMNTEGKKKKRRKIRGKDKIATAPLPTQVYKKRMRNRTDSPAPTYTGVRNRALRLQSEGAMPHILPL
jgi:hypothetical protein